MATTADWNMWLQQSKNGAPADPLAPLNQQYGGSLAAQPTYNLTAMNTPAGPNDIASSRAWAGAPAQGGGQATLSDDWNKWRTSPQTPSIPTQMSQLDPASWQQGERMGGTGLMNNQQAAPQTVNNGQPDPWGRRPGDPNYGKQPSATTPQYTDNKPLTPPAPPAAPKAVTYDPARDKTRFEFNGRAGAETAKQRIDRWTADNMREYGLDQQNAYYAALARLKRDYERSPGEDWRDSGFDLSGIAALATEAPVPGQRYAPVASQAEKPQTDPVTGKPKVDPQTGLPQTDTTKTPFTPGKGFFSDADLKLVADDPAKALAFWQSRNGGRDKSGAMGAYRDSMMAKALQAYLNTLGVGGNNPEGGVFGAANTGLEDMLGRFQSGQGVGGMLRDNASRMMNGIDFSNMDGDQIQNILNLAAGAATFGAPTMAQYGFDNAAEDLKALADEQFFNGGGKTSVLADPRNRQKFTDLLSQWLQLQQGG